MRERVARHCIGQFWTSNTMQLALHEFLIPDDLKVVFILGLPVGIGTLKLISFLRPSPASRLPRM
jgi:hypothetical protein